MLGSTTCMIINEMDENPEGPQRACVVLYQSIISVLFNVLMLSRWVSHQNSSSNEQKVPEP
jgi:hypothetical protein